MNECIIRKATLEELAELDRELGPIDKTRKRMQHGYDEQFLRPHRVVPRRKGDTTIRGSRI